MGQETDTDVFTVGKGRRKRIKPRHLNSSIVHQKAKNEEAKQCIIPIVYVLQNRRSGQQGS